MNEIDVAVIGGGVVGLSCALTLAESGASVCVIERESRPGRGMSTHNSGVIHAGIYYPPGSLKARLCLDGRERLYEFCERHSVAHKRCGKLLVAGHEGEIPELEALRARGVSNGATSLEMVDAGFVRRKEPHVHAVAAVWSPDTGIIEAEALISVLGRLCRDQRCGDARGHRCSSTPPHRTAASSSSRRTSVLWRTPSSMQRACTQTTSRRCSVGSAFASNRAAASTPSWRLPSAAWSTASCTRSRMPTGRGSACI